MDSIGIWSACLMRLWPAKLLHAFRRGVWFDEKIVGRERWGRLQILLAFVDGESSIICILFLLCCYTPEGETGLCWQLFRGELENVHLCLPDECCDLLLQTCIFTRRGISTEELLHVRFSRTWMEFKKESRVWFKQQWIVFYFSEESSMV